MRVNAVFGIIDLSSSNEQIAAEFAFDADTVQVIATRPLVRAPSLKGPFGQAANLKTLNSKSSLGR
jgi:hypothetical protein